MNLKSEIINTSVFIKDSVTQHITNRSMLFGSFFEFMNEFLNGEQGLWAQEIYDRGFDHFANCQYAAKWEKYNNQSDNYVSLDSGGYNKNGIYYQNLKSDISIKIGIKQNLYLDIDIGHDFYIYIKNNAQQSSEFKLELISQSSAEIIFQQTIEISNSQWQKYEISIPPINATNRIALALCLNGAGDIDLDEVSLIPINNVNGVRKEFFDMFMKWKPGIIRYPGGWFADTELSHLNYCIGDIDQRKSPQFVNGAYQRMDFGINEFITFCKAIHAQAHLVVNLANGDAQEAANWVDYTNGDSSSVYGQKRIESGYKEPFYVNYWEIGNEQWYDDDLMLKKMLNKYIEYYDAMKKRDNRIRCIIDGNLWGGKEYFDSLMNYVGEKCENYGWHYAGSIYDNELAPQDSNITFQRIMATAHNTDHSMEDYEQYLIDKGIFPHCKQSITEHILLWGTVNNWIDTTYRNSTLESGIYQASTLMSIIRHSYSMEFYEKTFGIGHIRMGFNKMGKRVFYPTPFHTMLNFFANNKGDGIIYQQNNSPEYEYGQYTDEYKTRIPYLESLITCSGEDTLNIFLLNTSPFDTLKVDIFNSIDIDTNKIYESYYNSNSLLDHNSPDEPEKINFKTRKITNIDCIYLEPHSFYCIQANYKKFNYSDTLAYKNISIMPNPANNILRVILDKVDEITDIKIYNMLGQCIIKNKYSNNREVLIDISDLIKGNYYINIKSKNFEIHKFFLKQ